MIFLFNSCFFFFFFFFEKIVCPNSCLTCYGGNDNQCLSCPIGKVLDAGSCLTNCSHGNYPDENQICQGIFIYIILCDRQNKLGCQYPCSTCFGPENGECLTCISPTIRNGTTCISESNCTQNGFIDSNRDCQGFSSSFILLFFSFLFLFLFLLLLFYLFQIKK